MKRTILIHSLAVGAAAFVLQWLDFQHAVRTMSTPVYVVIVALLFARDRRDRRIGPARRRRGEGSCPLRPGPTPAM